MSEIKPFPDGWERYQERVLSEIHDLKADVKSIRSDIAQIHMNEITELKVEIAMLKIKSGLWGAAAGLLPAGLLVAYEILKAGAS